MAAFFSSKNACWQSCKTRQVLQPVKGCSQLNDRAAVVPHITCRPPAKTRLNRPDPQFPKTVICLLQNISSTSDYNARPARQCSPADMPEPVAKLEAAGAAAGAFGARAPSFSFAFCTACMSHHGDEVNSRTKSACWRKVPATHHLRQSYSVFV